VAEKIGHFVLTRFNIGLYARKKRGIDTDAWMQDRMRLFNTYCAPSVHNQTCRNFWWYILVDLKTPNDIKSQLKTHGTVIEVQWPDDAVFTENENEGYWKKQFINSIENKTDLAVMTRLDCDDAFHKDYVARIQAVLPEKPDKYIVDCNQGYIYDERSGNAYCINHGYGTPFLTYCSKTSWKMQTVYYACHHLVSIKTRKRIVMNESYHGWCMIIHNNNISNSNYLSKLENTSRLLPANWNEIKLGFVNESEVNK
jgi:hypothetical protein